MADGQPITYAEHRRPQPVQPALSSVFCAFALSLLSLLSLFSCSLSLSRSVTSAIELPASSRTLLSITMHFLASLPLLALVVPARAGFEVPAPHLLQERDGKHIGPPLSGSYKRGLDDAVVVEARDGRHLGPNPSGVAGYRRHATSPLGSTFGLSAHRWKREILERDTCSDVTTQSVQGSCYPALSKAKTPAFPTGTATPAALAKWFCPAETEYAWLGFSYDVSLRFALRCRLADRGHRSRGVCRMTSFTLTCRG